MKIGIFDSGFGGVTVLKDIVRELPDFDYLYLGDNARAPYGDRSHDVIYEFTKQGVEYLFKHDCAIVILACNSASARALRRLQQEWLPAHYPDRRILGVIIPVIEYLISHAKGQKVGVIGTRATVGSHVFGKELEKYPHSTVALIEHACPLLVPLIEEGAYASIPARMILKNYLRPLKTKHIKLLVLGCTHYPILLPSIKRTMGKNVRVLTPGTITARSLKEYLSRHTEINEKLSRTSSVLFLTTDLSDRIAALAQKLWERPLTFQRCSIDTNTVSGNSKSRRMTG